MKFKLCLLFATILCLKQYATASSEALLECGRVHQIDNIANLSSATASYSNSQCMLVCVIGSAILPVDSIHEGQRCPEDVNGICQAGHCIGGQEDALRECGLKHNLDFHKVDNHLGTSFTNDQCALRCVIGGVELPVSHLHQGSPCPANPNGVCRAGTCVTQSTNLGSTVSPIPPTTVTTLSPPQVTTPSKASFSPSKMKLLNITLESTDPPLKQKEFIYLYFRETQTSSLIDICNFYGNPNQANHCYHQNMADISTKLNKDSQLEIILHDSTGTSLTQYKTNLYSLIVYFYQHHEGALEEFESFVDVSRIYHKITNDRLMDVGLRFTIVFSED